MLSLPLPNILATEIPDGIGVMLRSHETNGAV